MVPLKLQSRSNSIFSSHSSSKYFSHTPAYLLSEEVQLSFVWGRLCTRKMNKILKGRSSLRCTPVINDRYALGLLQMCVFVQSRITSVLSPASSLKLALLSNFSEYYSKENMCLCGTYHLFFLLKNEMLTTLIQREVLKASGWDHKSVSLKEYFRMIAITWAMLQNNPP